MNYFKEVNGIFKVDGSLVIAPGTLQAFMGTKHLEIGFFTVCDLCLDEDLYTTMSQHFNNLFIS